MLGLVERVVQRLHRFGPAVGVVVGLPQVVHVLLAWMENGDGYTGKCDAMKDGKSKGR